MMARRRGISLVELLLTMTACAVILTLSAGLVHRMLHAQSRARGVQDVQRSAFRLERSFRYDVHQAAAITQPADDQAALLRLQLPDDQTIEYRQTDSGLERVSLQAGDIQSRETFTFTDDARFRIDREQNLWRLSAVPLGEGELTAHSLRVSLHVEAAQRKEQP